ERLAKTIERLRETVIERKAAAAAGAERGGLTAGGAAAIRLRLVQQVSIEPANRPAAADDSPAPLRWRTSKAQELFLYLLQYRGRLIRKSALTDLLWPEAEADKA